MPTPTLKQPSTPKQTKETAQGRRMQNLKHQERKATEKLERIKGWPKEHQEEATQRTTDKLNNIREEMKKSAS